MAGEDGGGGRSPQPRLQYTDFESMSHAQLVQLLASANAAGPADLARKLSAAAKTISKIGEDLKTHVGGLSWHGEGGDTFREWGNQTANATLRLGEYSKVAGHWLAEASQAIAEAKAAMPPLSETTDARADLTKAQKSYAAATDPDNRNDPDARTTAQTARSDEAAAQGRMDAARGEAVQRLRKLAQTYEFSAQQVQSEQPPTFPPPAMHLRSDQWEPTGHRPEYGAAPAQSGGAGVVASAPAGPPPGTAASGAGVVARGPSASPAEAVDSPPPYSPGAALGVGSAGNGASVPIATGPAGPPVSMEIDSVAPLPQAPAASPPAGPNSPPITGRPDVGPVLPPGTMPPIVGGSGSGPTPPGPSTGTGRPITGTTRPVGLPGQSPASPGTAARMPRDSGIIGGRPTQTGSGRPTGAVPRGTVIGSEVPYGRGPVGAPGMGAGTGGSTPGRGGSATGRRLARESGGVIGGLPQQTGRTTGGPFTPGGTKVAGGGTPVPPPGTSQPRRRDDRRADRPGLTTEDEETWQQGQRPVVPPVIDN
ncbi:hypothetical protein U9R90_09380 [Streptomyces sp. E11-3]|uniref:hypothetical protein n=1 Tax=Streptomyces sp. E11-3 TaxID=3110112 RepID=UPI00397ECDB2